MEVNVDKIRDSQVYVRIGADYSDSVLIPIEAFQKIAHQCLIVTTEYHTNNRRNITGVKGVDTVNLHTGAEVIAAMAEQALTA
jgi:hypothetical protein